MKEYCSCCLFFVIVFVLPPILLFLLYLVLVFLHASNFPYSDRYTMVKPNEMDLVGTWKSEDDTETLVLREDKTCVISGTILFGSFNTTRRDEVSGKWAIEKDSYSNHYYVELIERESKFLHISSIDILDNSAPHTLMLVVGDTDAWNVMLLNRVSVND